jgi:hypothetical protein
MEPGVKNTRQQKGASTKVAKSATVARTANKKVAEAT